MMIVILARNKQSGLLSDRQRKNVSGINTINDLALCHPTGVYVVRDFDSLIVQYVGSTPTTSTNQWYVSWKR